MYVGTETCMHVCVFMSISPGGHVARILRELAEGEKEGKAGFRCQKVPEIPDLVFVGRGGWRDTEAMFGP